jgi:hypothetical protein
MSETLDTTKLMESAALIEQLAAGKKFVIKMGEKNGITKIEMFIK